LVLPKRRDLPSAIERSLEKKKLFDREISIRYVSSLRGKSDLSDYPNAAGGKIEAACDELVALRANRNAPRLNVLFDGHDLRKYGSSGQQQRACSFTARQSVGSSFPRNIRFSCSSPGAELDYKRRSAARISANKTQTFDIEGKFRRKNSWARRGGFHGFKRRNVVQNTFDRLINRSPEFSE